MKHPEREEWIPYLWGEASDESKKHLAQHLDLCAQCRDQVASLRRTIGKLDRWTLPARAARHITPQPILKWAMAALLILGVGFGLGRFSSLASIQRNRLQSEIETALKSALSAELQSQLQAAQNKFWQPGLASIRTQLGNDIQAQLAEEREQVLSGIMRLEARENRRLVNDWAQVLRAAREEDRQNTLVLVRELQKEHEADYVAMRKDLETVASLTDDEIQQARLKLIQISANTGLESKE